MKHKPNYSAWNLSLTDFPKDGSFKEQIQFLLKLAVLAPSSHNSQPWKFDLQEDHVVLEVEKTRELPASDKKRRQLFVSLGCALENLLLAADAFGFNTNVKYFPQEAGTDLVAVIYFEKREAHLEDEAHLAHEIPKRHTNREKYSLNQVEEEILNAVLSEIEEEVDLRKFQTEEEKHKVADMIIEGMEEAMESKDFRVELARYVKHNLTKHSYGMPGFTIGMPTPVSFVAPHLMKLLNVQKLNKKMNHGIYKDGTPMYVVIHSKSDDEFSWVKAGQQYQRIALKANRHGLGTHVMAAPIEIGNHSEVLREDYCDGCHPQICFRIGYPEKKVLPSPRFLDDEVTK